MTYSFVLKDQTLFETCTLVNPISGFDDKILNSDTLPVNNIGAASGMLGIEGGQVTLKKAMRDQFYVTTTIAGTEKTADGLINQRQRKVLYAPKLTTRVPVAPTLTHAVEVTGRREVGFELFAFKARAISMPGYLLFYQWLRDGVAIPGGGRPWYRQVDADVGHVVECRCSFVNRYGWLNTTSTGGAATTLAAAYTVPNGAAARYVSPGGTGDALTMGTPGAIEKINRYITEVGPGGKVLLNSAAGPYTVTGAVGATIAIFAGGSAGNEVEIVGVDFTTGRERVAEIRGDREQPVDYGTTLALPRTQRRGMEIFTFRTPSGAVTVDPAADTLTNNDLVFGRVPTGTPIIMSASGTGFVMPDGLVAGTIYYFIPVTQATFKLATTRANALAGIAVDVTTAGVGTIAARTAGDRSVANVVPYDAGNPTASNYVEVSADLYNDLEDFRSVQLSTTGTMPTCAPLENGLTTMPATYFWYVKKLGSNRLRLYQNSVSIFTNTPVQIASPGTGVVSATASESVVGANWMKWRNLGLKDAGAQDSCLKLATWCNDLTFEDIQAENVYRVLGNTSIGGGSALRDASAFRVTLRRCSVWGAERAILRLRYACYDIKVEDCWCDARNFFDDRFPSLFNMSHFENNPRTTTNGADISSGPGKVRYQRCGARRSYAEYQPGEYWQGDGFETSQDTCFDVEYSWCEASWCSDGGFDDKATGLTYNDCQALFCKRHYRLWNNATMNRCYSIDPQGVGGFFGENGGTCHFGIFKVGLVLNFNDGYIIDSLDQRVFDNGLASGNPDVAHGVVISFNNLIARLDPVGRFSLPSKTGNPNTLNFNGAPAPTATVDALAGYTGNIISPSAPAGTDVFEVNGFTPAFDRHVILPSSNGDFEVVIVGGKYRLRLRRPVPYVPGTTSRSQAVRVINGTSYQDLTLTYYPFTDFAWRGITTPALSSSGNLVLSEPTGAAQGDLLIACVGVRGTVPVAAPAGWTEVIAGTVGNATEDTSAALVGAQMFFTKRGASAPDLTFTRTGGSLVRGTVLAYRNGGDAVLDAASIEQAAASSVTTQAPSVTTTAGRTLLVLLAADGRPTGTHTGTTDMSGAIKVDATTERLDSGSSTSPKMSMAVYDELKLTAGATGVRSATSTLSSRGTGILAAFRHA